MKSTSVCSRSAVLKVFSWVPTILESMSHADRTRYGTVRGSAWCPLIKPHSSPSTMMEMLMEDIVPMLRMYSKCTGETERSTAIDRSRLANSRSFGDVASVPVATRTTGEGV